MKFKFFMATCLGVALSLSCWLFAAQSVTPSPEVVEQQEQEPTEEVVQEEEPAEEESAEEELVEEEPEEEFVEEETEEEPEEEEIEEEEEEEPTGPIGPVAKWEDIGFEFDELVAAPLPKEVAKPEEEPKIPEITELGIDFGSLSQQEIAYVDEKKSAATKQQQFQGLPLRLPVIGDVFLAPIKVDGQQGYEVTFPNDARTINAGILEIESYSVRLVGQELSFVGKGTLLNKKGTLYLKRLTPSGLVPLKPVAPGTRVTPGTAVATAGDVEQIVLSFIYEAKDRPTLNIVNVGELLLESTDVIFQKNQPVLVVSTAQIFKVRAEVGLALTKRRVNAFINVQGRIADEVKCKEAAFKNTLACTGQDLLFKDVIPQITQANKSIGESKIRDLIFKINNVIVLPPLQPGKKPVGKSASQVRTQKPIGDQLTGNLTAIINLEGTDLATDPKLIRREVSKNRPTSGQTKKVEKGPLEAQLVMDFDKLGYNGTLSADLLYIKNLGKLEGPSITTSVRKMGPTSPVDVNLNITGELIIPLEDANVLRVSTDITMMNQGIIVSGTIPQFIYKKIQLKNLQLSFDTVSKELMLAGTTTFAKLELAVNLSIIEPTVENCDKAKKVCIIRSKEQCEKKAKAESLTPEEQQKCEKESKEKCEKFELQCIKEQQESKKEGTDPKRAIAFTARLKMGGERCANEGRACLERELALCKKSVPEKTLLLNSKKKEAKDKEAAAVASVQEAEAKKLWQEYDKLTEEIFKLKKEIADCNFVARTKCQREQTACEQKQVAAKKQSIARAGVTQVREELAQAGTTKPAEKVTVEEISYYPFKDIKGVPAEMKSIKLTDIDVGLEFLRDEQGASTGFFYLRATVHAFGVALPGLLKFVRGSDSDESGILLTIPFMNRVTLTQLFPYALKGAPFNTIYVEKPVVSISTVATSDPETRTAIPKGVVVSGKVPLSEGLENVGKLIGKEGKLFGLTGIVNWENLAASQLKIAISADPDALTVQEKCKKQALDCVKKGGTKCEENRLLCEKGMNDLVTIKNVEVVISFAPSLGVKTGIMFRPPMQKDKPLVFEGGLTLGIKSARIEAGMAGTWYNAFGLKGWEMSDTKILLGQTYGAPLPSEFGGTGRIKVIGKSLSETTQKLGGQALAAAGSTGASLAKETQHIAQPSIQAMDKALTALDLTMEGAFKADATMTDMAFMFKTTKVITWTELLLVFCGSFFESIGKKDLASKLHYINSNMLKVSELEGNYSANPLGVVIGSKVIPQGMGLGFKVDFFGKQGQFKMQVSNSGIEGLATLDKIDTKYFKLTGAGEDKILGTADDAPIIRLALNLFNQEFYIDGKVMLIIPQMGSMESLTRVDIGFDSLRVLMSAKVFNQFNAEVEAKIASGAQNIYLKGKMQQSALAQLENLLKSAAKQLDQKARKDIAVAQTEVNKLRASGDDIKAASQRSVDKARQDVQKALQDLNAMRARLDAATRACGR